MRASSLRCDPMGLEAVFGHVVEGLEALILVTDGHFRPLYVGPQCETLCGISAEVALETPRRVLAQVDPASRRALLRWLRHADASTVVEEHHFFLRQRVGTRRRKVAAQRLPAIPERPQWLVWRVRDIRDRVGEDRWLGLVSHELRMPLTAIKGAASLLRDTGEGLGPEQEAFLDIILRHCNRLNRLVGDLLDFSKLSAGMLSYRLQEGDLSTLVTEACRTFEPAFVAKGLALRCEVASARACFDADRMVQVLSNLLSNACKFTPPGGTVTVRCGARDQACLVEVQDNGIGIPAHHLDKLFTSFYRVEEGAGAHIAGTGLGLAISKSVVEDGLGGRLEVETEEGKGSLFRVVLPRLVAGSLPA